MRKYLLLAIFLLCSVSALAQQPVNTELPPALTAGDINNAAAIAGSVNVAPVGRYNATQPTLTDTRYNLWQLSARGELLVSPGVSAFAVQAASSQSGTWNITNISGTISLPTGAATSANQTTIIGHLDGVEGILTTIDADTSILSGLVLATQADDVVNTADGLQVSAFGYFFDGSTWDRVRGTSADGLLVNLGANNDVVATATDLDIRNLTATDVVTVTDGAGALNVIVDSSALPSGASTLAEQQTQTTALQLIDDSIFTDDTSTHATGTTKVQGIGAVAVPTDAAVNANDIAMPGMSLNRELWTSLQTALPAGTNNIGDVDVLSFPDNEPVNISQMNGVAVTMGNGASGTGVQRVTIASDSGLQVGQGSTTSGQLGPLVQASVTTAAPSYTTAQTSPLNMTTGGALRTDTATVAGVVALTGNGAAGTGSQRVTIASDNTAVSGMGVGATGASPPANAIYQASRSTGGFLTGVISCDSSAIYSASTNGNTELVALTASQVIYICSFEFTTSQTTAVTVRLVYGTGTACATGETSITPTYTLQAAASTGPVGKVWTTANHQGLKTIASNALCVETNAGVAVQAMVTYVKF